jgi:hypothetical protein
VKHSGTIIKTLDEKSKIESEALWSWDEKRSALKT